MQRCIAQRRRRLPDGLAPTTSTTLMLALGDALAVALMERKGLRRFNIAICIRQCARSRADPRLRHHAWWRSLPLVAPDTAYARRAHHHDLGRFGVGAWWTLKARSPHHHRCDLRRHMARELVDRTARDVMTLTPRPSRPICLPPKRSPS